MEINNETLGETIEKVICDIAQIDSSMIIHRTNPVLEQCIKPLLEEVCRRLPRIVRHVGTERGQRGGQSKSTIDFYCENGESISVKSNKNSNFKVCPSECGQPGTDTFDRYFGHLYEGKINYQKFKMVCLQKSHDMMPIYLEHLFDCDYFVWIYIGESKQFHIIRKKDIPSFVWEKEKFSFSRDINNWNESCTVYYDSVIIGEYQAHQHRNCYKFRFNILHLCNILGV